MFTEFRNKYEELKIMNYELQIMSFRSASHEINRNYKSSCYEIVNFYIFLSVFVKFSQ